jgi:hypothetical protein
MSFQLLTSVRQDQFFAHRLRAATPFRPARLGPRENSRAPALRKAASTGILSRLVDLQPAESGQILAETQPIWTVNEGWPRKRRPGMRCQLAEVEAEPAALRARNFLLTAPTTDWGEAAAMPAIF